jgi:formate dehydrogenase major subunit
MDANQKTVNITMDGRELAVEEGITVLEAARRNDIHIPTLCYHPALSEWGGCRMCVVELDGAPKLAASCVTPVRDGMEVVTANERILEARRTVLEFLFAERNHNCMFCPQSGDCELQNLAYELGMDHLSVSFSFNKFPTDATSEDMIMDHNRCILCGRCVRACAELAGSYVLNFQNRGPANLVGLDLNASREESTCFGCGICLQVCPTGAIYNRYRTHYAVKGHEKNWEIIDSVCPQCGLLCPTVNHVQDNTIVKIEGKPFENGRPDRGQLCYRGRFGTLKSEGKRLLKPMVKGKDGAWKEEPWGDALSLVASNLKDLLRRHGGEALFGLASGDLSNEALLFFRDLMAKGFSAGSVASLDRHHPKAVSESRERAGESIREIPWTLIPEADFIVLLGADLRRTQPMLSTLVRRNMIEKGGRVAIIGKTESVSPFADFYFPLQGETLPPLIKAFRIGVTEGMKKKARKSGWASSAWKANVQGLLKEAGLSGDGRKSFDAMVAAFVRSTSPFIMAGEGVTGLKDLGAFRDAVRLARAKGDKSGYAQRLMVLKPSGNSAGAWKLGLFGNGKPRKWKGGMVLADRVSDADSPVLSGLGALEFLAVMSPYFPEGLADKAHVLIPKPLWTEENGSFTSLNGAEVVFKRKILDPPEGVMDSWEILKALADHAGLKAKFSSREDLSRKAQKAIKGRG